MKIPFVDLRALHAEVRPELEAAFTDVLEHSSFVGGSYVDTFEKDFAAYCSTAHAVSCASGTDALKLALLGVGIAAGDGVLTTAHTFIATVEAITQVGAMPVFVDIDRPTYNLSPQKLADYLESQCYLGGDGHWVDSRTEARLTAVLPVHLYGLMADMGPILELAAHYNLKVIEDACQAHGARYFWKGNFYPAGYFGGAAGFSFYPGKNLGALGEGGAVTTQSETSAKRMRLLRDHGSDQKYRHISPNGWNSRLDALQCAFLDIKLKKLDEWNARRRQVASWYAQRLAADERITLPVVPEGREPIDHLYGVRVPQRQKTFKELGSREIACGLHYPTPLHLQKAYRGLGYQSGDLPEAEAAAANILSLPMFPHMSEEMVDVVCRNLREAL